MRHWALTVGINHYQFFQPLSFAQSDAQALHDLLIHEFGFAPERCLLLTETSPPLWGNSTYPNRDNIEAWIERLSQQYLQPGDVLWFLFSGYGVCHQGQDYLVPIEANPAAIPETAIPVAALFDRLRRALTESILVLLDINRSQSSLADETLGTQTANLATQLGVSTILSCHPGQFSRESAALGQGFFTAALLEGLRSQRGGTIAELEQHLHDRLPQLSEQYLRPIQQPLSLSLPQKRQQPLLPQVPAAAGSSYPLSSLPGYRPTLGNSSGLPTNGQGFGILPELSPASLNGSFGEESHNSGVIVYPDSASTSLNGQQNPSASNHGQVPPDSAPEIEPEIEEPGDREFWRPILFWGGLATLALLLGVLLRHWSAWTPQTQTPGPQITKPTPSPVNSLTKPTVTTDPLVSKPSPEAVPAPTPPIRPPVPTVTPLASPQPADRVPPSPSPSPSPTGNRPAPKPSPSTSQLAIARAKIPANSAQASPYWFAIQEARKIKPGQPEYQQAQVAIASWSQTILNIARRRASQKVYDAAIMASALVPVEQPALARQAKEVINQSCPVLSRQVGGNPVHQRQAQAICQTRR